MIEIVKFSATFENADTRKRQRLGWINVPTGCDSKGFRRLSRLGVAGFTALGYFQALCQAMGTLSKNTRLLGRFQNGDGTDMEFEDICDLARLTGIEMADHQQITGTLVACGWILLHKPLDSQQSATSLPPICQSHAGFVQGEGKGEGEGEESPQPPKGGVSESETDNWEDPEPAVDPIPLQAETIVNAYPRKERVANALEVVIRQLRNGASFEEMLKGTKAAAAALKSAPSAKANRYAPNAEKFFRDLRWMDDANTIIRPPDPTESKTNEIPEGVMIIAGRAFKV